jgi:hypothetical protein
VFKRFELVGSIRQVLLTMRAEKLRLPVVVEGDRTGRLEWKLPVYNTIHKFIVNPVYAGAYVYGKTESRTKVAGQVSRKTFGHRKEVGTWGVLIPDHHLGYISWDQYKRNQSTVSTNANMKQRMEPKAGRGGRALLAGLLRCRRCGRMLHVCYGSKRQPTARYECNGANINHGEGAVRCHSFGALRADEAIARALLDAVSPKAIEAAVDLARQMASEQSEVHRAAMLELEQARYDAKLACRRYDSVDPDNRLVATELEMRWNAALNHVKEVEKRINELTRMRDADIMLDKDALLSLAERLPNVWNSPAADMKLKQRIVRMLVREIVSDVDAARYEIVLVIHWQGGQHTELRVPKNRPGRHNKTASIEVEEVVRRMAGRWTAEEIAATLNRIRLHTGTGLTWNESRVAALRKRMGLKVRNMDSNDIRRTLTLNDAVERLGVSNTVVLRLIREGKIPATQVVPDAPYEIDPEAMDDPKVLSAAKRTRERGRHARKWSHDRRTLKLPGLEDDENNADR